ncbi:MAG: MotA/TolQ/ExbB proton channel family protein [Lentisphaerae bacterium]|nr:MotA/TolQ/ExbB proton channel family protein [Lentisphaerota bacterium]
MSWMQTVVDLCIKGGFFMIPLGLVALAGIVLTIERLLYLRENRLDSDQFHFDLKTALKENSIDQAIVLAARTKGVIGRVLQEGLLRIRAGEKDVGAATEKIILAEMLAMEKSRGWIVNMSQVAPLLGILGTVWGLVIAFMTIERTASTDPRLLAGGIYQALLTTVAGLVIAIPLIIFQEHLRKQTNHILGLLDLYLVEIKEWLALNHKAESARNA